MVATGVHAQSVRETPAGVLLDGRPVSAFVLTSGGTHPIRVRILTLGGIIQSLEAPDRQGHMASIVIGLRSLSDYEKRPNFSAIIGRYANRISHGGFALDGRFHRLKTNAAGVISHGGPGAMGAQVWQASAFQADGRAGVRLTFTSPDGFNGFPGALTTTVTYSVGRESALRIDYTASSTRDTVINLTNHAFFNLSGKGSTDNQWLRVMASHYTPNDAHSLPTGAILPVSGALDLRRWTRLGSAVRGDDPQLRMAHGFDLNYIVNSKRSPENSTNLPVAACAFDPGSGRALVVASDQPGLQVYTGNGLDGSLIARSGAMIRQGDAFALETQHFPDSPNHPNFPSTVLRAGRIFHSRTEFRLRTGRLGANGIPDVPGC